MNFYQNKNDGVKFELKQGMKQIKKLFILDGLCLIVENLIKTFMSSEFLSYVQTVTVISPSYIT